MDIDTQTTSKGYLSPKFKSLFWVLFKLHNAYLYNVGKKLQEKKNK